MEELQTTGDLTHRKPAVQSIQEADVVSGHHRDFESMFNDQQDSSLGMPARRRRVKSKSAGVVAMGTRRQKSKSVGVAAMRLAGATSDIDITGLDQLDTTEKFMALTELTRLPAEVGSMYDLML